MKPSTRNKQASQRKTHWLLAFSLSLMLMTQTAHADFRKALEAYQNRDGDTLLKEVKDAVDKKNDDGLILFISAMDIDYTTSRMTSFEPEPKSQKLDLTKLKSTWETILTETQQKEIFEMLDSATKRARVEARYKFLHSSLYKKYTYSIKQHSADVIAKELLELADKGSLSATYQLATSNRKRAYELWEKAANSGSGLAAFMLSMDCLRDGVHNYSGCPVKDDVKGAYWLKKAVLSNDTDMSSWYMASLADAAGKLYQHGYGQQKPDPKEAYLWYLLMFNSGGYADGLEEMRNIGQLKQVAPQLDANWDDQDKRIELLSLKKLPTLPIWLQEKQQTKQQEKPVLSLQNYAMRIGEALYLDVYADGRVNFHYSGMLYSQTENVETTWKLSPKKVQDLMSKIQKLGVDDWTLYGKNKGCKSLAPSYCQDVIAYVLTLRNGKQERSLRMSIWDSTDLSKTHPNDKQTAQLLTLFEEYFPTQKLRCTLGTSNEYKKGCLQYDQQLQSISM